MTKMFHKNNIDTYLQIIINYFIAINYNKQSPDSPTFINLWKQQLDIRLQLLHYGFFHKDWILKQTQYHQHIKLPKDKNQALARIKRIIKAFW